MHRPDRQSRRDWGLALRAAVIAGAATLVKLAVHALDWDTVGLNPLYTGLVAATVFLLGFLLAGTLADYKESERLPGELAARVAAIADECQIIFRKDRAESAGRCMQKLEGLAGSLNNWLRGGEAIEGPLARIQALNVEFADFEEHAQPPSVARLKVEQGSIRQLVTRIDTIRETSFVGAGYLIAEIASVLLVLALLVVDMSPAGAEFLLLAIITFVTVYMILLIRDLDDPFDYGPNGKLGAAEVSIAPLERLERRMQAQVEAMRLTPE